MIWHVVMIRFKPEVTDEERRHCESALNVWFEGNPDIVFYRMEPSLAGDNSLLVITGLPDREALQRYYDDQVHIETKKLVQSLREPGPNYIDIETDDPVDALRRSFM